MKLKKIFLTMIGLICFVHAFAQSSIDYQPKALLKALQKSGISNPSGLQEIPVQESASQMQSSEGKFFQINSDKEGQYKYVYVGRVNSCRAGGCSAPNILPHADHSEYFDYYVLFDSNKTVQAVKVYNYQATHGQEVTAKGWLKQFIGYNGSESLQVNKNIDSISGATISVYAITLDIEIKTEILHDLVKT